MANSVFPLNGVLTIDGVGAAWPLAIECPLLAASARCNDGFRASPEVQFATLTRRSQFSKAVIEI
jgi:hypothetical protein